MAVLVSDYKGGLGLLLFKRSMKTLSATIKTLSVIIKTPNVSVKELFRGIRFVEHETILFVSYTSFCKSF